MVKYHIPLKNKIKKLRKNDFRQNAFRSNYYILLIDRRAIINLNNNHCSTLGLESYGKKSTYRFQLRLHSCLKKHRIYIHIIDIVSPK